MTVRERFFECTYSTVAGDHVVHLRAWSAAEADLVFRRALAGAGITAPGTLVIRGPGASCARSAWPDGGPEKHAAH
jgi:hypothetical protein